ncbi:MAG: hypothetical protein ND807_11945 [Vicinamibacterales bacterium]|jgi:hypothetical protein|nr:hypothetical protein [Vicinamibacterales bacterium]
MNRYVNIGMSCATAALLAVASAGVGAQSAQSGNVALGAVRIPRAAKPDGKPLPAGTYQIRVTMQEAQPSAPGQTPSYERWAEFVQGGQVKGREVVSVVPQSDIAQVAKMKPPTSGSCRAELLKGDDYYRVWCNRAGTHYLVHLAVS